MVQRLHILGASESGTTTLGRVLAARLQCPHFDTDDYFWLPTDSPYSQQRERTERARLLMEDLTAQEQWVVSGSLWGWGDGAIPLFELVVFLVIPQDIRMERLCQREHERFGERIRPGGDMYEHSQAFFAWTASHDDGELDIRQLALSSSSLLQRRSGVAMQAIALILMAIPGRRRGIRIFRCSMTGVSNFRSEGREAVV
jgi:adenylate kinase family enzyme